MDNSQARSIEDQKNMLKKLISEGVAALLRALGLRAACLGGGL